MNGSKKFVFNSLPANIDELHTIPEFVMDSPYKTAALLLAVLCNYEKDPENTYAILDELKGPDIQCLSDIRIPKESDPWA